MKQVMCTKIRWWSVLSRVLSLLLVWQLRLSAYQPTMSSQANWNSVTGVATLLFDGNLVAITIAVLFTFGVPILLHIIFFQAAASPPASNFLLLGPSGSGKTALATLVSSKHKRL